MVDQRKAGELARAGFDLWQAGRLEESVAKYKEALECADPEHYAVGDYHGEYAAVLATLGRYVDAREQYELEIAHHKRQGDSLSESVARGFLSDLLLQTKEPLQALEIASVIPDDPKGQQFLRIPQAKALWELGRRVESREAALAALESLATEKAREKVRSELGHILNE